MMDEKWYANIENTLGMVFENNRLASFKNQPWIFSENEKCSATKLAEAGFYFVGDKKCVDVVKCFLCEKTLDGWEKNDDPWSEHIRHSRDCKFAKLNKPEESLTFQEMSELYSELINVTVKIGKQELLDFQFKNRIKHVMKAKRLLSRK